MNLSDAKVMLCNCDGTMTLDGTKLAKACGAEDGCKIATSLCRQSEVAILQPSSAPQAFASLVPSSVIVPSQLQSMTLASDKFIEKKPFDCVVVSVV